MPPGRSPSEVPDTPGAADTTAQRGTNSVGSAGVAADSRGVGQAGSGTTGGLSPTPAPAGGGRGSPESSPAAGTGR